MDKLRVLHVIGGGEFGGAERHILNLAAALDPAEVSVAVACLFARPFADMAREAGLEAYAFPMRYKTDFRVVGRLVELTREGGFHLVHTHGVRANLIGRLAARRAGRQPENRTGQPHKTHRQKWARDYHHTHRQYFLY